MKKLNFTLLQKTIAIIATTHLLFALLLLLNVKINLEITFVIITLLLIFMSFISTVIIFKKNIYQPIAFIQKSLETNERKYNKLLLFFSTEFSQISILLQNNNNQKFELNAAKIKAEESERLETTFLENLSHEIRTPMNAIIGFTDLLLTDNLDEKTKTKYLSIIHKSGGNLVSILEDLIEISKIDTNQIVSNYTFINLEDCLIKVYNSIKLDVSISKKIDFKIIPSKTPIHYKVKMDEVKLNQILLNLIYNALKFTEKGSVSFGYAVIEEADLEFIEFKVSDTGIGIRKENQKIIFERFKRIENDKAIEKGGLGLGLSITKAYVEMMGGEISINSSEEKGSVFSFKIPLKYDKEEKEAIDKTNNNVKIEINSRKTILIAEDDNINFILILKMFQETNHNILRAENGLVAVNIIKENPNIDLVLMDIKMPIMNGYEAFENINKLYPNLPIIAQTAHASAEDKTKTLTLGFSNYITKPLNKELLLEMVKKYC